MVRVGRLSLGCWNCRSVEHGRHFVVKSLPRCSRGTGKRRKVVTGNNRHVEDVPASTRLATVVECPDPTIVRAKNGRPLHPLLSYLHALLLILDSVFLNPDRIRFSTMIDLGSQLFDDISTIKDTPFSRTLNNIRLSANSWKLAR